MAKILNDMTMLGVSRGLVGKGVHGLMKTRELCRVIELPEPTLFEWITESSMGKDTIMQPSVDRPPR
jgi:hypothetical protein